MIKKLLCWIGIHDWSYKESEPHKERICIRCHKMQEGSYDMTYGEQIWE